MFLYFVYIILFNQHLWRV